MIKKISKIAFLFLMIFSSFSTSILKAEEVFDKNEKSEYKYWDSTPVTDLPSVRNWTRYGDILVTNGKNFASSSYVGHAAIVDIDENYYVESCKKGLCNGASKEGVQYRSDYKRVLQGASSKSWGRFQGLGAVAADYKKTLGYAQSKVGMGYNYSFQQYYWAYYCSELVAYAWDGDTYRVEGGLAE